MPSDSTKDKTTEAPLINIMSSPVSERDYGSEERYLTELWE